MSLKTILNEMSVLRDQAAMTTTAGSLDTNVGRLGLKRAADEGLKRLRLQYRNELMGSAAFIIVTGSERNSFSNAASGDSFGCFSADPEDFFTDLVSRVDSKLYGRESVRHLFTVVSNILEDKALELDIGSYNILSFNEKYNIGVSSAQELASVVKRAVLDQVGSEIVGINAVHGVTDAAIQRGHQDSVIPLILNTEDDKLALDLQQNLKRLTSKVFMVVAGKGAKNLQLAEGAIPVKTVSEKTVGEALSSIRSKIL